MNHEGLGAKGEDRERLATALEAIAEVLVGEQLESVRGSTSRLDSKLSSSLDSARDETRRMIDELRDSQASRVEQLLNKVTEAEESQKKVVTDFEARLAELQEQVRGLQDNLAQDRSNEESLKNDLADVSAKVETFGEELGQQRADTKRISSMLDGLASVLGGQPSTKAAAEPATPEPVPVEVAVPLTVSEPGPAPFQTAKEAAAARPEHPAEPGDVAVEAVSAATESGEIDNVLERAFGDDS